MSSLFLERTLNGIKMELDNYLDVLFAISLTAITFVAIGLMILAFKLVFIWRI